MGKECPRPVASGSEHYIGKVISSGTQNGENLGREADRKGCVARGSRVCRESRYRQVSTARLAGPVHGFATPREANWSRSSFCSVTFPFRQPNDISVANSGFKVPSTTKSE